MARNYLKGTIGNEINAFLAAAGFNFKGLLNKIKEEILWLIFSIQYFYSKTFPKQINRPYY